jgi:hypothetical protein
MRSLKSEGGGALKPTNSWFLQFRALQPPWQENFVEKHNFMENGKGLLSSERGNEPHCSMLGE